MKSVILLVSAAMVVSSVPAVSSDSTGPLAPGGAAGVQQAQGESNETIYIAAGVGAAIAIGVLLLSNNNNGGGGVPAPCCTVPPITTTTTT
jgi:hypothetical protein